MARAWRDASLRTKGLVVVAIPLVALMVTMTLVYLSASSESRAGDLSSKDTEIVDAIQRLRIHFIDAETGVRGYMLARDPSFLDPYRTARRELPGDVARLDALTRDAAAVVRKEVAAVPPMGTYRLTLLSRLLEGARSGAPRSDQNTLLHQSKAAMDQLRQQLSLIENSERELLESQVQKEEAASRRGRATILLGALLGLVAGLLAMLLFLRGVVKRVRSVNANADRLAVREPLLDSPLAHDELGDLEINLRRAGELLAGHERELEETKAFLEELITLSPVVKIRFREGSIDYVSPNVEAVLGYPADQLMGETEGWDRRIHPDDRESMQAVVGDATARKEPSVVVDYRFRHADDSYRCLSTVVSLHYENDEFVELYGYMTDVTDRIEAQDALELARQEADRANLAKSEFLSRMSHEFRTPLNGILGFGQLLDHPGLDGEDRDSARQIVKAGKHLLGLVNEVLDISRIEAGKLTLSLEPVNLSEALQESADLIAPVAAEWNIELIVGAVEPDVFVNADRQRLKQVLLNLLSNGVKYNRENGRVELSARVDDGIVTIEVSDTGPGIDDGHLAKLFIPFERLGADASNVEGAGLGLSLSKRLVEAMGGRLTVTTQVGQGTVMGVELRLAARPGAAVDQQELRAELTAVTSGPATLLYIEDNLSNFKLVDRILSSRPWITLLSAMQGRMGIDLARDHLPDAILLDLDLPDMSGAEVLKSLASDPRTASIPVIVVTADATSRQVDRLFGSGAAAYLTKPLEIDNFLSTIDQVLAERTNA